MTLFTPLLSSFRLICLLALFSLIRSAASILKIRTVENGCVDGDDSSSRRVKEGDFVYLDYEASIDASSMAGPVGHVFDSSYVRQKSWGVVVTSKHMNMVQGLFEGLLDMCEGEKRVITIPPELGFGETGALPNIPGGATLRYEVVCVSIRGGATKREMLPSGNVWSEIDVDGDWRCTREELDAWFAKTNVGGQTEAPEGLFAADDVNGDGIIEWHEFRGPKGKSGPHGWNGDEMEDAEAANNPIHSPASPAPGPVIITANVMARQDDEPQCSKDGVLEPCFVDNESEGEGVDQEVEQAGIREYTREPPFAKTAFERNKQPTSMPLLS